MADMSEMLKSFSSMMEGKEIPDNIKEMLNSLTNNPSSNQNSENSNNSKDNIQNMNSDFQGAYSQSSNCQGNFSQNNDKNSSSNSSSDMPNIDINTIMKMQKFMSAMNSNSNSSGANLLRSLKPYLKPSRQSKVDEYIQLFNIEKVIQLMNQSGGDR